MSNELTIVDEIKNPALVFVPNGLDGFLQRIKAEAEAQSAKATTIAEAKSIRYGLKKTKTSLDKLGKDLGEEYREKIKVFNAERNRAIEFVEALEIEVYAPWQALEDAEKARVDAHEKALADMQAVGTIDPLVTVNSLFINDRLQQLPTLFQRDWQEFGARATFEHNNLQSALNTRLEAVKKHEAEQAELARLRAEEMARLQKEREDKIAAEAAAKAKADAEAVAKVAADAAAKREADAKAALVKADADRIAALAKAESDAKAAAEAAAKAERERQASEKAAEEKAAADREANTKHKAKVNNDALAAVTIAASIGDFKIPPASAQAIIIAIAQGKIPHVKITY